MIFPTVANAMKTFTLLLSAALLIAPASSAQPAPPHAVDGSAMKAGDIAKHWRKAGSSGVKTRGFTQSDSPAHTRGAGLSRQAVDANAAALDNLRKRGIVILNGGDAAAAQAAQDQTSGTPAPAFVRVPVAPEKQIAFRLRFQKNSTHLADEESQQLVSKIAQAMQELPETVFLLEGHTCDLGAADYNQRLSEARALKVRALLGDYGIAAKRLLSVGQGERGNEVPNTSEANRALNRRVMIGPIELPPKR